MKIGVLAELLRKPLLENIDYAAKLGVDGVQLYASHGEEGYNFLSCTNEELITLRNRCEKNNLVISAICGDISPLSFQVDYEWSRRAEICCKLLDTTAKLGVKVMTTHIGCIPESVQDPVYSNMIKGVRAVADHAEKIGCFLAIETGPELADVLRNFIEKVGSPALKVNLDPANLRGVSCEDPVYAVEVLAPYIVHTHAKDANNVFMGSPAKFYGLRNPDGSYRDIPARASGFEEVPLGQGMVNFDTYLAALRKINYQGFLTIERECGDDPAKDISMAVEFLKNKLKAE